jgi:hypothetical protein
MKEKGNYNVSGFLTIQQTKNGEIIKETFQPIKNVIVETGREFILDLLIGNTGYYNGHLTISNMAAGSINMPASADDWKLYGEGTLNQGGAVCRVPLDPQTNRTLTTITFHGVFTTADFPGTPYPIGEIGAFLGDIPPTNDPQNDSTQRPNAMFNRLILNPVWTKYNDGTDLRFIYTLELTET